MEGGPRGPRLAAQCVELAKSTGGAHNTKDWDSKAAGMAWTRVVSNDPESQTITLQSRDYTALAGHDNAPDYLGMPYPFVSFLAMMTHKSFSMLNSDLTPAGFRIRYPSNYFRYNHAAGSAAFGFWLDTLGAAAQALQRVFFNNTAHDNADTGVWVDIVDCNGEHGITLVSRPATEEAINCSQYPGFCKAPFNCQDAAVSPPKNTKMAMPTSRSGAKSLTISPLAFRREIFRKAGRISTVDAGMGITEFDGSYC